MAENKTKASQLIYDIGCKVSRCDDILTLICNFECSKDKTLEGGIFAVQEFIEQAQDLINQLDNMFAEILN